MSPRWKEGLCLSSLGRVGGLRGQGPVSRSSQQLVRARLGPSQISHMSAQLETRERQDSEAERPRQTGLENEADTQSVRGREVERDRHTGLVTQQEGHRQSGPVPTTGSSSMQSGKCTLE